MRVLKISILALILASCGNSVEISNEETTSNNNNKVETDVIAPKELHFIIGDWFASANEAGVDIKVSFSEDGTFSQDMAGQSQTGTWETVDENQVKIDTENMKNGQIWKITEKGDDEMKIVWSIKDGLTKGEITFRKN